jgi:hypothetical protein
MLIGATPGPAAAILAKLPATTLPISVWPAQFEQRSAEPMQRPVANTRRTIMNKFLIAIALVTAFSAPALAALQKAPARPDHRHVEPIRHQWKGGEAQNRSANEHYWQPCDSTFHSYIVNNCD